MRISDFFSEGKKAKAATADEAIPKTTMPKATSLAELYAKQDEDEEEGFKMSDETEGYDRTVNTYGDKFGPGNSDPRSGQAAPKNLHVDRVTDGSGHALERYNSEAGSDFMKKYDSGK